MVSLLFSFMITGVCNRKQKLRTNRKNEDKDKSNDGNLLSSIKYIYMYIICLLNLYINILIIKTLYFTGFITKARVLCIIVVIIG